MARLGRGWHLLGLALYGGVAVGIGWMAVRHHRSQPTSTVPLYEARTAVAEAQGTQQELQRQEWRRLVEEVLREQGQRLPTVEGMQPAPPPSPNETKPHPPQAGLLPPLFISPFEERPRAVRLSLPAEFFRNERAAELAASQIAEQLIAQGLSVAVTIAPSPAQAPQEHPPSAPSPEAAPSEAKAMPSLRPLPSSSLPRCRLQGEAETYGVEFLYRIALGETQDAEAAREWATKLRVEGWPAAEEGKVVALGPFLSRQTALAWQEKAKALGLVGTLEEMVLFVGKPAAERYGVQVAACRSQAFAQEEASLWRRRGFPTAVSEARRGGRILWRVRIGPLASSGEAELLRERLVRHAPGAFVIPW